MPLVNCRYCGKEFMRNVSAHKNGFKCDRSENQGCWYIQYRKMYSLRKAKKLKEKETNVLN